MPRDLKKRGRREEKKRKAEEAPESEPVKRTRIGENEAEISRGFEVNGDAGDDYIGFGEADQGALVQQEEFYGLLEEDEQAYFANVNAKISANDFESDEDRALFIEAVHRETHGKELKVASSQSCSRYLEKVILLSNSAQLKSLFKAFLENLTYLVQHRFGSHCTEALFLEAARYVSLKEVDKEEGDGEDLPITSLFLRAVEELKPNMGYLVTDRFATHCIRVLMLVLSGESLDDESLKVIASSKKEKIDMPDLIKEKQPKRKVPQQFRVALNGMVTSAISSLDATYIRALATHPTGNPFLQLALKLELSSVANNQEKTKQPLYQKLFPDEEMDPDSATCKFIQGLIYDPTGSHLVEVLIQHLPGRVFKKLYNNILKAKMGNYVRNDVASYIAARVIERLGKDDLFDIQTQILPEIPALVLRSRLGIIKTLYERLSVRHTDNEPLNVALKMAYGDDSATLLPKMLQTLTTSENLSMPTPQTEGTESAKAPGQADLHGSLLAQAMLKAPISCELIHQSLLAQPRPSLLSMAKSSIASRALQTALTSDHSSLKFRKQFIPRFYGSMSDMAQDAAGSHLADALWQATNGLHFMKEILARELATAELTVRESLYGRNVWRNWSMDTYSRRPRDWQAAAKGLSQDTAETIDSQRKKSAIQLARERHAKNKMARKVDVGNQQT